MNWKKLGVFSILLFMIAMTLVIAAEPSATPFDATLVSSRFYQEVSPYIVPGGMGGLAGLIVGVITIIILFVIFIDILTIATPFSEWVSWIISIGMGIIAVLFKINVTVAGWIFTIASTVFAWTGALAVAGNIIIGILIILAIFFPMNGVVKYIKRLKIRKEKIRAEAGIERIKTGFKTAGEAGKVAAEEGK
ncbi:hypothetical protein HYT26_03480 [Candidatus Pacearchaeota archaeon]|nr:hypothetical protein [Candidatus Pacearchaeota archaeon]